MSTFHQDDMAKGLREAGNPSQPMSIGWQIPIVCFGDGRPRMEGLATIVAVASGRDFYFVRFAFDKRLHIRFVHPKLQRSNALARFTKLRRTSYDFERFEEFFPEDIP